MPKFVWVQSLRGPMPQILHDQSVFGVTGDKPLAILQAHDINENEEQFSLDLLSAIYPFQGGADAAKK
jgi:hypothetical protein